MQDSAGNQPHSPIGNGACPPGMGDFRRFSTSVTILGALDALRDWRILRENWCKPTSQE